MARKRSSSLKDKNVFKRSELEEFIGSPTNGGEEEEEEMATEKKEDAVAQASAHETAPNDEAPSPVEESTTMEGLPRDEAELDLAELLSEEAAVAATDSETAFADEFGFPPTLETPPAAASSSGLPAGEAYLGAEEDEFGFPMALETPPTDALTGDLPAGEADLGAIEDDFGFPPALEGPPSEVSVADLPLGEAATALETSLEPSSPPAEAAAVDFSTAYEAGPATPAVADLPPGEAGFDEAPAAPEPAVVSSFLPESAAPPSVAAAGPATTPASVVPGTGSSPPATPPQTEGGPAAASRTPALTLADENSGDLFDFGGMADEPKTPPYQIPGDVRELTPEERQKRMSLLKDKYVEEQFEKLYRAVDEEYKHILDDNVSSNQEITDWAHNLLAETRYILMNYQIEHLPKAEWNVQQVRARLDRAEESEKWRQKWSWPILGWGLIWFFVFVILAFNPGILLSLFTSEEAMSELLVPEIFLRAVFFGGVGGVASVFFSIIKYTATRCYDKEYNVSYVVKPFMGMIVGTLIYLLIYVVARPFGIAPTITGNAGAESETLIFEVITYFLALAAGFQEHVFFRILGRLMKIIMRDEPNDGHQAVPLPPPGPSD